MENLKLIEEKSPDLMYIDTRFDVPETGSFMKHIEKDLKILDHFVLRYGSITRRMLGFEISHKAKKPHYHIRYEIERNEVRVPAAFGAAFTYYYKNLPNMPPLPKGCHMVKALDKPDNFDAWFQYPLKSLQKEDILFDFIIGFSYEYIISLWNKAVENQRIALVRYEKEEKKKNNEILEYGKLTDYLDKNFNPHIITLPVSDPDHGIEMCKYRHLIGTLAILVIQYYKLNHDSKMPTKNKLISTLHRYCSQKDYLSPQDLAEVILNF